MPASESITPVTPTQRICFGGLAVGVMVWWVWLWFAPAHRALFRPKSWPDESLLAFVVPDTVILATFGIAIALGLIGSWACYAALGGWAYATLYCLAVFIFTGEAPLAVILMFAAFCIAAAALAAPVFRPAAETGVAWIFAKTLAHMSVFWIALLFLTPMLIVHAERDVGISTFSFKHQERLGGLLFVAMGALGLTSAWQMASVGRGTPLPLDAPRRLVVCGPYRFVRNPMAIAGLVQCAGVGVFLGSWMTLVYAGIGGALWQLVVRPAEERELLRLFGPEYETYRSRVRCWIPGRAFQGL